MGASSYLSINELQRICYELDQENPNLNVIGKVTKESRWNYFVNALRHRSQPRLVELIGKVNQTFTHLEQKGVKIFDLTIDDKFYQEKAERYRAKRQIYLDVVEQIGNQIEELKKVSPELQEAYHELQCRAVGLRYSLGGENGGLDALDAPDQERFEKIRERAQAWKQRQKLAVDKELNKLELAQLEELAKYPEWLDIVLENPQYRRDQTKDALAEVFNWSLRDFNQVEVIVKCYETQRKLKASLLASNLGYVRNIYLTESEDEVLAFQTVPTKVDHVAKRILTLAIYHGSFKEFEPDQQERINILKPTKNIHFKQGNYNLTVEEFLHEVGQKHLREANITLCADWGFSNFHPVKGVWNADLQQYEMPEMTEEDWTDDVPPSRIASHEELVAQYGDEIKDRNFFFKVMATRQHLEQDHVAFDAHAFWQFYIRMEDGNWKVLNIGVYASRFAQGLGDGLGLFCATLERVVCLLDQNCYYTHRQRGAYPIFPDEEVQEKLLARIFLLMHSSGVFQFAAGHNCAYPVQKYTGKLVEDLPNFFKMDLVQVRSGIGLIDKLLAFAERCGGWVSWLIVTILHKLLLSGRSLRIEKQDGKIVDYSIGKYLSEHGHETHNPAYLPYQINEARKKGEGPFVKGELYWSHTEEKLYQREAEKADLEAEEVDLEAEEAPESIKIENLNDEFDRAFFADKGDWH